MSWHLFFVMFLLLVGLCTCGPAYAASTEQQGTAELFVKGQTQVPKRMGDKGLKEITYFQTFSLLAADGVMAAFAAAESLLDGDISIDIVARYIGTEGKNWAEKVTESKGNNWKTQLAIQKVETVNTTYALLSPVAVAKDNKIYLLFVFYKYVKGASDTENKPLWDIKMSVGEIKPTTDATGGKTIEWKTREVSLSTLTQQLKDQGLQVAQSGVGSAFLTEDGRIVFVLGAKRGRDYVYAIIHSKDKGKNSGLDLSYAGTAESCYSPRLFEWDGRLIITPAYCLDGKQGVKESTDAGKKWGAVVGSAARVWDNLKDKDDFTTVTIENKKVLLFTQERNSIYPNQQKYEVHLWFSDANRVHDIGPIVVSQDILAFKGLLYTNGELFYLKQEWGNNNEVEKATLTRLKDQLEGIKSVLRTWAEKDEYLSRPCRVTVPTGTFPGTLCVTPMPTDGLVGFLSNTTNGDIWLDEYLYANATVRGGTKVASGFKFTGAGSGAQWSLGKQGVDQRYNFAKYGLTVVATVTIHNAPGSDTPLLTLGRVKDTERLGLWYGNNSQWKIKLNGAGTPVGNWVLNKTYRVALMLHNKYASVYVDGKLVGNPLQVSLHQQSLFNIQHLFIGGYKDNRAKKTVNHVTVTNVFLYNRPFNHAEFEVLGRRLKDSADGTMHVRVGGSLLFVLGLWGFAALC